MSITSQSKSGADALGVTFLNMVNDLVACALIEGARPTSTATLATKAAKQLVLDAFETVNVQRERLSRFECRGCSLFSSAHELVDGKCPRCHCAVQPAYIASVAAEKAEVCHGR